MAEYLSPGVYVEEYDNSPRSMEGVGTSTAGFVGMAVRGPSIGAPSLVTDMASFTRQFGGYLSEFTHGEYRFLASSVEQFFSNGGTKCFVSRVIPSDAKKAEIVSGALTFKAANEGKWGNRIQITIQVSAKKKMQLLEKIEGRTYKAKSVDGFRESDVVTIGEEYNRIVTIFDDIITFEYDFTAEVVDKSLVPQTVIYLVELDMQIVYNDVAEVYTGLSLNITNPMYIGNKLKSSELVSVEITLDEEVIDPMEAIFGSAADAKVLTLEGGLDGSIEKVSATTFIGEDMGPGKRTGIQSFMENNVVSMMAVPGVTLPDVIVQLVGHCENLKSRFAVLDMPMDLAKIDDLLNYRGMVDSTYAAMYHPWIQSMDRTTQKPGYFPPSGSVLGVYSRTDINRGVHKAPANEVVFCTGLKDNYTAKEQGLLNPEGVNLIRALPGQGIRIWGARTASSNSTFRYVNVRRLFIFVEESIKANTNWVVFEPNDAVLWARVRVAISAFLDNMWRAGMLVGDGASDAYFVDIGPSTMSQDDIMSGRLICNIGIAPSRPAEFVIFRVTQHTATNG